MAGNVSELINKSQQLVNGEEENEINQERRWLGWILSPIVNPILGKLNVFLEVIQQSILLIELIIFII